jgi:hypothetical protein
LTFLYSSEPQFVVESMEEKNFQLSTRAPSVEVRNRRLHVGGLCKMEDGQMTLKPMLGGTIKAIATCALLGLFAGVPARGLTPSGQESQQAAATSNSTGKVVGKVKAVADNVITLTTDAGDDLNIQLGEASRLLRAEPGQKDLKSAAPVRAQDVQPGDRLLARGRFSEDGKFLVASTVLLMKAADVSAKQEHDREEWRLHGVGGLVSGVDLAGQAITISVPGFGGNKTVKITAVKNTIVRRYAPDSIKFDDAKTASLAEVKSGDQLRARGDRSSDGSELSAQEIVFGTFRNIAGTVISTDAAKKKLIVTDLATKKLVVLDISADSQLRKLLPMIAQRIATRLKGGPPEGGGPAGVGSVPPAGMPRPGGGPPNGEGANGRTAGPPDFQQMLSRMPAVTLADLQKGDAVMIVSTEGTASAAPKAVTLLTGVEPILVASPDRGRAAMLLSPWNLGEALGAGEAGGGVNP